MSITVSMYPVMPTRPCSFCLSLQDSSVFADFEKDASGIVFLRRISFDGYGCCEIKGTAAGMSPEDSRLLLEAIASDTLNESKVEKALRKYFRENESVIWRDALATHKLL